ncbi:hypothetical protein MKW98_020612 [Papaver atlanticum]|uniref:Uncharacterized protein n=1 Tax=Papaver atlanticum TaxID=357466 RepID=A0AAD4TI62_9MAGN|nr:hypothetical protein MKW98_020612 [Papaver atlanticum]
MNLKILLERGTDQFIWLFLVSTGQDRSNSNIRICCCWNESCNWNKGVLLKQAFVFTTKLLCWCCLGVMLHTLLEFTEVVKYLKHPGKFARLGGKLLKPQEMCSLGERQVSYWRGTLYGHYHVEFPF